MAHRVGSGSGAREVREKPGLIQAEVLLASPPPPATPFLPRPYPRGLRSRTHGRGFLCPDAAPNTLRQEFLEWSFAFLFAADVIETQQTLPLFLALLPSSLAPLPALPALFPCWACALPFFHPRTRLPSPPLASFYPAQTPQFLPPYTHILTRTPPSHTQTHTSRAVTEFLF